MENKEIIIPTEEQIKDLANRTTPVRLIESSLSKFLADTFIMAREEDDYQKAIKAEVLKRLPEFKSSELIALLTSASTNKNDMLSKLISPTMQLLTAAQQNEMATKQKEITGTITQNNIKEINNIAPTEVLQGLQALFAMATAVQKKELIATTEEELTS